MQLIDGRQGGIDVELFDFSMTERSSPATVEAVLPGTLIATVAAVALAARTTDLMEAEASVGVENTEYQGGGLPVDVVSLGLAATIYLGFKVTTGSFTRLLDRRHNNRDLYSIAKYHNGETPSSEALQAAATNAVALPRVVNGERPRFRDKLRIKRTSRRFLEIISKYGDNEQETLDSN